MTINYPEHLARADRLLTADELRIKYQGPGDGEHPTHPRSEWRQEVMCEATLRGYWDWVQAQCEEED